VPETIAPAAPCILVVEDNPFNMMLVVAVLGRAGLRSAQASSAEEARRLVETVSPDLILMDIQLPGQDGLSLTRELKTNSTTTHIPIIALTAHAMKGDGVQAIAAGCDAYVAKPIDTRTFATFVTRFLPRRAETVQ
jgi:two-component system, cell cycle response regulator DivK